MNEKKFRTRKQPLACLPDLDDTENIESEGNEAVPRSIKKSHKIKNGKENIKKTPTNSKAIKNKRQSHVETDSDSDFDELWSVLKKSGVKATPTNRRAKPISSPDSKAKRMDEITPKPKSTISDAHLGSQVNKSKSTRRKRLYSEDSNAEQYYNATPAKRSRRASTISQESVEDKKYVVKEENSTEKVSTRRNSEQKKYVIKEENSPKKFSTRRNSEQKKYVIKEENSTEKVTIRGNSEQTPVKANKVSPIKICRVNIFKSVEKNLNIRSEQFKDKNTDVVLPGYRTPPKIQTSCTPNKHTTPVRRSIKGKIPRTPLENARTSLHVAAVPSSLPCREQEYQNIFNFVENKVIDGIGGCMYISGVPGTGKTATVTQVIRKLQEASSCDAIPQFKYIEINGMKLSDPRQAYVQLYQQIFEKKDRISSDVAQKNLDKYFNKADKKKTTTVLLVDELDLMCNRKQDVVYNLLDWPSKPYSRLVVLTIANTMDMPERKLKGRVNSRLGLTRLTFLPYTHKQLEEIVLARLQGTDAFVLDAVRLATRKVAAVSGDARRALDICRRAAELPALNEPVRIAHIEQAIKEMTNSNIVRLIRSCSELEKLFLKAVSEVCIRTGLEEVDLLQIVEHLLTMCVLTGLDRPPIPGVLALCHRLKCFRLLFTNNHRGGLLQRITLNLTQDDLHYALKTET